MMCVSVTIQATGSTPFALACRSRTQIELVPAMPRDAPAKGSDTSTSFLPWPSAEWT